MNFPIRHWDLPRPSPAVGRCRHALGGLSRTGRHPIAADDCILVLEGESGDLLLLDAITPEHKELSRTHAVPGPECWAPPILSDGRLLVRGKTTLTCLDLR